MQNKTFIDKDGQIKYNKDEQQNDSYKSQMWWDVSTGSRKFPTMSELDIY